MTLCVAHSPLLVVSLLHTSIHTGRASYTAVLPPPLALQLLLLIYRNDADALNENELARLSGEAILFQARDTGDPVYLKALQHHCPAKATIALKEGAQVILVKTINPEQGLVNGLRGVIVRFDKGIPMVKFTNGKSFLVQREVFTQALGGAIVARRIQVNSLLKR